MIRVQLSALQDYANHLEVQINALQSSAGRLDGCPAWGNFGQAKGLTVRHAKAVSDMRALLTQVRDGIAIGRIAAQEIAQKYGSTDELHRAKADEVNQALAQAAATPASTRAGG